MILSRNLFMFFFETAAFSGFQKKNTIDLSELKFVPKPLNEHHENFNIFKDFSVHINELSSNFYV